MGTSELKPLLHSYLKASPILDKTKRMERETNKGKVKPSLLQILHSQFLSPHQPHYRSLFFSHKVNLMAGNPPMGTHIHGHRNQRI